MVSEPTSDDKLAFNATGIVVAPNAGMGPRETELEFGRQDSQSILRSTSSFVTDMTDTDSGRHSTIPTFIGEILPLAPIWELVRLAGRNKLPSATPPRTTACGRFNLQGAADR